MNTGSGLTSSTRTRSHAPSSAAFVALRARLPQEACRCPYVISTMTIHDPAAYKGYTYATPPIVKRHKGRFLTRRDPVTTAVGERFTERLVILEFPDPADCGTHHSSNCETSGQVVTRANPLLGWREYCAMESMRGQQISNVDRFRECLQRLRALRSKENRVESLREFLGVFPLLLARKADAPRSEVVALDRVRLANFCNRFRLIAPLQRGLFVDVWKLARLQRDELRHAAILRWLLDERGSHSYGSRFLSAWLKYLSASNSIAGVVTTAVQGRYFASTETYPLGNDESRIDIEIEGQTFLVFVEVKVDAPEGREQVRKYLSLATAKAVGRPFLVIFLSTSKDRTLSAESPNVLSASWKELALVLQDVVRAMAQGSPRLSDELIVQFARHIGEL